MRIPVHHSLKVARSVVNKIQVSSKLAHQCSVMSWSNCRAQGLHIMRFSFQKKGEPWLSPCVNIAQSRRSDDILVCYGDSKEFDNQTHQESEHVYRNQSKHFRYDEEDKAAKWIAKYLETGKI